MKKVIFCGYPKAFLRKKEKGFYISNAVQNAQNLLSSYWGHSNFRPQQAEIIEAVTASQDVLAVLPTGGGKSVCYQIPALMMQGLCLVVSPLIALMKDQVQELKRKNIPAGAVYSGMAPEELTKVYHAALDGQLKMLYLSPERLQTLQFQKILQNLKLSFVAIDEAHCISQWGFDFRPKYLEINNLRETKADTPFVAFTATATKLVQDDIIQKLDLKAVKRFSASFIRQNLHLKARKVINKTVQVLDILQKSEGSAIVYCRNRRMCRDLATLLAEQGVSATYYHAGMSRIERDNAQDSWKTGIYRVIVSTNAFGMGIDKQDVRNIIHYHMPISPEAYYQEIGRAGRDGLEAHCTLLYNEEDINWQNEQVKHLYPSVKTLKAIYNAVCTYLKIPMAHGEGISYELDLKDFISSHEFHSQTCLHALKHLSRQKIWTFDEHVSLKSRARVTSGRDDLAELSGRFPNLHEMVQLLLRLYGGIIQHHIPIDEWTLAKKLKRSYSIVEDELIELNARSYISYQPKSNSPRIFLLQDRTTKDRLIIDEDLMIQLKKRHIERVEHMNRFVQLKGECRMQFIAAYFNEESQGCNHCDNCLQNEETSLTPESVKLILEQQLLDRKHIPIVEFAEHFPKHEQDEIKKIIRYLIKEKQLKVNSFGALEKYG